MKKEIWNRVRAEVPARSENEAFLRSVVCAFLAPLDVTVEELSDVRCAVSEAVTNAVVHAYKGRGDGKIVFSAVLYTDRSMKLSVRDYGCGIGDVQEAMQPLYTTDDTGERSGMGFAIMQSFMDGVRVKSAIGRGTFVEMRKRFSARAEEKGAM